MCSCLIYDNFVSGSCCGYHIEMLDSVKFLTSWVVKNSPVFLNRRERYQCLRFSSLSSLADSCGQNYVFFHTKPEINCTPKHGIAHFTDPREPTFKILVEWIDYSDRRDDTQLFHPSSHSLSANSSQRYQFVVTLCRSGTAKSIRLSGRTGTFSWVRVVRRRGNY